MVGFPDFIYKHIVPACFLAPLKPTFDLSDAQTVLVSFCRVRPANARSKARRLINRSVCFSDAVRVRSHAENDSSQKGKTLKITLSCEILVMFERSRPLSSCRLFFRGQSSSSSCSRSTCPHFRCHLRSHRYDRR